MRRSAATTICLGDEYDAELRARLMEVLRDMGGRCHVSEFGVAGSQETEALHVCLGNEEIVVEAETYVGLTIRGDEALVKAIAERVRASVCE